MRNILIFSIIIGAALLTATYPLTSGWGYAARTNADQSAADRIAARVDRVQVWDATRTDRVQSARIAIYTGGLSLAAAFITAAVAWSIFTVGKARAAVAQAMIAARCIPLDPSTRQYPLVLDNPTSPRFVFNPNTGAVTRLATAQEYAPQLAANAVQVQAIGAGLSHKLEVLKND